MASDTPSAALNPSASDDPPTPLKLFLAWFSIGGQSFGGGPSTLQLIRDQMVVKHKWITEDDYVRMWALCTLAPGINLLAFATLIGRKLAGWLGIVATLGGMLVPSGLITTLLTAGFTIIQGWPPFQAVLRGVIPATAGLMFMVLINMGRPLIKQGLREGQVRLILTFTFIVTVGFLIGIVKMPVFAVLFFASALGAFFFKAPMDSAAVPAKEYEEAIEAEDQEKL